MSMSLVVVGFAASAAAWLHGRDGHVRLGVALPFAAAGLPMAFLAGRLSRRVPDAILLVAFAILMLAAAASMLRRQDETRPSRARRRVTALLLVTALGAAVGGVTGLLGVGGGFLIVPALVSLYGLPMKQAIGTSLVVIALNCAVGFAARAGAATLSFATIAVFSALAVAGAVVGHRVAQRLPARRLRQIFAAVVVTVALYMLARTSWA
jgi:hypothetical protein